MKEEVKNGIVLSISVILIIVIVYFATGIFMTGEYGKKVRNTTTTSNASNSYNNLIMASNIFNKAEDSYMVILFSKSSASNELYDSVTKYSGDTKLYVVNLDDPVNKYIKSNKNNLSVSDVEELKVKDNALLVINNGMVTKSETNGANIISLLK